MAYVVRPRAIRGTPTALSHDLGPHWRTRFYPNLLRPRRFDYRRDFIMTAVPPNEVNNATPDYAASYQFATRNKFGQRRLLAGSGVPVPAVASSTAEAGSLSGEQFVVRPLRHSRSMDYRVTQDRLDFRPGEEYISELYPKRREYRIIFVYGQPLIVLRKKPNEGVTEAEAWGHVNSFFQTIIDVPNSRLAATDAFLVLAEVPAVRGAHIVAADILYSRQHERPWVCLELNFCPSLEIDNNRAKVVEAIRARV